MLFFTGTGEPSYDFMLVYASNAPEEFDWAINDRIDEIIEFTLPTGAQRKRMILQYLDEYLYNTNGACITHAIGDGFDENQLDSAVAATEGFSGREIHKLVVAWQAAAFGSDRIALSPCIIQGVLDAHVVQKDLKASWNVNRSGF